MAPARFYFLSVYPGISLTQDGAVRRWAQAAERLKFTVQAEFINEEYDFSIPAPTTPVPATLSPPSAEKVAAYYESFKQDAAAGEDGASKLLISASASIVALAALTLY